ncbi:hypothetical protein BH23ACT11_BH23ACT11_29620 [soil metagenome]
MSTRQREGWENLTFGSDNREARERLRELILYIADKCEYDRTFGAVKLNKILFFADFVSFAEYGESITGIRYKKYQQGPVPTALRSLRDEMESKGDIVLKKKEYHGRTQNRVISLREPDFDKFRARDIALVDKVIEMLWERNAVQVSEMSHNKAWKNASEGEAIPYEASFVSDEPLTERDIIIAEEMIAEYERFEQSGRS